MEKFLYRGAVIAFVISILLLFISVVNFWSIVSGRVLPTSTTTSSPTSTFTLTVTPTATYTSSPTLLELWEEYRTPTETRTPEPTLTPSPNAFLVPSVDNPDCHKSYPGVCIPKYPPDLNCKDIVFRGFIVLPPDPHGLDSDGDGIGCEI